MVKMVSGAGRGFLRALIVYIIKYMDRETWTTRFKLINGMMASEIEFRRRRGAPRRRVLSASNNNLHQTAMLLHPQAGSSQVDLGVRLLSLAYIKYSLLLIVIFLFLMILLILLMMSSALSSLHTLPESMFKLPVMTATILSPLL